MHTYWGRRVSNFFSHSLLLPNPYFLILRLCLNFTLVWSVEIRLVKTGIGLKNWTRHWVTMKYWLVERKVSSRGSLFIIHGSFFSPRVTDQPTNGIHDLVHGWRFGPGFKYCQVLVPSTVHYSVHDSESTIQSTVHDSVQDSNIVSYWFSLRFTVSPRIGIYDLAHG